MAATTDNSEIYMINNEIHFNCDINAKTTMKLIEKLLTLQDKILKLSRDVYKKTEGDEHPFFTVKMHPILLFITTPGGNLHQTFSIVDTIENMKVPVHTICKGNVCSGGTLMSLSGKKRYMTKNSFMMIHELRTFSGYAKFTEFMESVENLTMFMNTIKEYYVMKTGMTLEEVDEQLKKDVYWNAATCLEKGLIDDIWEP